MTPGKKAASKVSAPPHVFVPNPYGPRDYRGTATECEVCRFPKANGVHVSSEELVASLPPVPPGDVSSRIIGEG